MPIRTLYIENVISLLAWKLYFFWYAFWMVIVSCSQRKVILSTILCCVNLSSFTKFISGYSAVDMCRILAKKSHVREKKGSVITKQKGVRRWIWSELRAKKLIGMCGKHTLFSDIRYRRLVLICHEECGEK